eukprot:3980841-Alexandrium_andersonii.AAC.1
MLRESGGGVPEGTVSRARAGRGSVAGRRQGAEGLASLAFAESVMLHCMRCRQQGWGCGG